MNESQQHTRIYCTSCKIFHEADYIEEDGCAWWRVNCPHGAYNVKLSSDARLFAKFRAQERPRPTWYHRSLSNCIIHINDDCSLQCPICFASAERKGWRMSLDEIRAAAQKVKKVSPANVMLMGGEPTEHPQILDILDILAHEFKFRCSILTNGVRIGKEPDFASKLKTAGLSKASISFDTFNPETSKIMRGSEELVQIKLQALENCFSAKLNCGFVTTMCRLNLPEFPELVKYYINHAGQMSMYEVQCYQEGGRVVPGLESVDREEIVKTLVASNAIPGLSEDDFRVSPSVPAAGYCINPDCGAGLFWLAKDGKASPLTKAGGPFDRFADMMANMPQAHRYVKWLRFLIAIIRCFGWKFLPVLRNWAGRGKPAAIGSLQLLSISTLMTPERLDCKRFSRCTNGVLTAKGDFCSPCFYYGCRYDAERKARS